MTEKQRVGHNEGVEMALPTPALAAVVTVDVPQFREIYDGHFDFVYRCARRMGVHERSLDDAVQDVFLVVHRRLKDFEGRSSVKTWIYGITRRVAKDYRRRSERKERGMVPAEGLESPSKGPLESAQRNEAVAILRTILDSFDDSKREVFVLAEMEQMTAPEIASALSVNLNTIYSRLRVARDDFEKAVSRYKAKSGAKR